MQLKQRINTGNPDVDESTNILDINVPKEMLKNISTGNVAFDALCAGDGMTPSTVMLLTGVPGAGKSTLELQLADSITGTGNGVALVNVGEESLYQVRRTCARLELKNGFIPSYETDVEKLIEKADKVRAKNPNKQMFLFVDSLQTIEVDYTGKAGRPPGQQNMAVDAAWMLSSWAKSNFAIVCLIGQVTKDGTFEGKNKIKHAIDVHMHLGIDTDRKSETYGERIAEIEKNRFGIAGIFIGYKLTASGLSFDVQASPENPATP